MTWVMNTGHSFRPLSAGMRIHDGEEELTVLRVSGSNAAVKGKDGKTRQISTGSEVRRWVENGGNGGNGGQHHASTASAPAPTLAPAPAPPAEPQVEAEASPSSRPITQVSLLSIAATADEDEDEDTSELGDGTGDGWEWSDPSTPSSIPEVEAAFKAANMLVEVITSSPIKSTEELQAQLVQDFGISDPLVRGSLHRALHTYTHASDRWHDLQQSGATDDQILTRIRAEFGSYGGGSHETGWYEHRGIAQPEFTTWVYLDDEEGTKRVTCHLTGKALVAAVREVLEIPRGWYDPAATEPVEHTATVEPVTAEPTDTEPPADEGADQNMSTNDPDDLDNTNDPAPDSRATYSLSAITELTGIALPTLQRYFKSAPRSFPHEGEGRARRFYPEAIDAFREMRAGSKAGRPPSGGKGSATKPALAPAAPPATKKPAATTAAAGTGAHRAGAKKKAIPPARHIATERAKSTAAPIAAPIRPRTSAAADGYSLPDARLPARSDTAMDEAMRAMERASLLAKLEQTEDMLKMLEGEAERLRKELGL